MARVQPAFLGGARVEAVPRAGAVPGARGVGEAVLERGKAAERLERGRCGVQAVRRAVEQRRVRLFCPIELPDVVGNGADERRRIVGGIAAHGHDGAVANVHDHGGGGHALARADGAVLGRHERGERSVDRVLHGALDGQVHVGALGSLRLADHVHHVALGVHDDPALAVVACEQAVVAVLDAALAHVVARFQGTALRHVLKLLGGDRPHVSQHVGRQRPIRIVAHGALRVHRDAGERVGMLRDERHVALADVGGHHALALRAARRVLHARAHHVRRHAQHGREPLHHVAVVGRVRIGQHREAQAVLHERPAVGVADEAARGGRGHGGVQVLLRFGGVHAAGEDLHAPQFGGQGAEHGGGEHAHGREAPLQAFGGLLRGRMVGRDAHVGRRPAARLAGELRPHAYGVQLAHFLLLPGVRGARAAAHGEDDRDDHDDGDGGAERREYGCYHGRHLLSAGAACRAAGGRAMPGNAGPAGT